PRVLNGLLRGKARMPAAPYHRQIGPELFYEGRELESVCDGGTGQRGDANAQQAACDVAHPGAPEEVPSGIRAFDIISGLAERARKREMRQRRGCSIQSSGLIRWSDKMRRVQQYGLLIEHSPSRKSAEPNTRDTAARVTNARLKHSVRHPERKP